MRPCLISAAERHKKRDGRVEHSAATAYSQSTYTLWHAAACALAAPRTQRQRLWRLQSLRPRPPRRWGRQRLRLRLLRSSLENAAAAFAIRRRPCLRSPCLRRGGLWWAALRTVTEETNGRVLAHAIEVPLSKADRVVVANDRVLRIGRSVQGIISSGPSCADEAARRLAHQQYIRCIFMPDGVMLWLVAESGATTAESAPEHWEGCIGCSLAELAEFGRIWPVTCCSEVMSSDRPICG